MDLLEVINLDLFLAGLAVLFFAAVLTKLGRLTYRLYKSNENGVTSTIANLFLALTQQQAWLLIVMLEALRDHRNTSLFGIKVGLLLLVEFSLFQALLGVDKAVARELEDETAEITDKMGRADHSLGRDRGED